MTCYECEHFDPKTKICDIDNEEILNPELNTKCDSLNESFKELKAENARLRKALQEIAEFATSKSLLSGKSFQTCLLKSGLALH